MATARWVEQQRNLINVAASRARRALIVVGHPTAPTQLHVPTLASLRKAATEKHPEYGAEWMVHSEPEKRLLEAMYKADLKPLVKPIVEGFELDFAFVTEGGGRFDIEVDGSQHIDARGRQRRRDVVRDRILESAGWEVLRYPAWRCLMDPIGVAEEIKATIT